MAQVTVRIWYPFQDLTDGEVEIGVAGQTIAEALDAVGEKYPHFRSKIYTPSGKLCGYIHILLNGEDMRFFQSEATPLQDGDIISIVRAYIG